MSSCNSINYKNNFYNSWSNIPYPGEERVYHGIDPNAGSWPLVYFKRNEKGDFVDPNGKKIAFDVANPAYYNFKLQLVDVMEVNENLTPKQIAMAKFWGTGVPAYQLGTIVMSLIKTYNLSPARSARLLSVIGGTQNDAFIICWYYKYLWDYPRPVQLNPYLQTVIPTPKFPTYVSGHSVVSGATCEVLSYYFPAESEKLSEIAKQASTSRLYAGVHFRCDCVEGLKLGKQIGQLIIKYLENQKDCDDTKVDVPIQEFLDAPIMPIY